MSWSLMNYNKTSYYLESNYGELSVNSIFDEKKGPVDTTFFFYYGAVEFTQLDSLITKYSNGTFPQYAINLTKHESRRLAGKATDKVLVEGGAGLKPVISAETLRKLTIRTIQDTLTAHNRPSADFEERRKRLEAEGKRWRFVATFDHGKTNVALKEVDMRHPFYNLEGSINFLKLNVLTNRKRMIQEEIVRLEKSIVEEDVLKKVELCKKKMEEIRTVAKQYLEMRS